MEMNLRDSETFEYYPNIFNKYVVNLPKKKKIIHIIKYFSSI